MTPTQAPTPVIAPASVTAPASAPAPAPVPARSTLTKEHIFEIANQLDSEGHNPTLALVRKRLGSGSFTTISEAMTEWKLKRVVASIPPRETVPESLTTGFNELAAVLWTQALATANQRLSQEREAMASKEQTLAASLAEAKEIADDLSKELEQEKAEKDRQRQEHTTEQAKYQATLESTQAEAKTAQARATTAEARLEEMATRANDLNAELLRMHEQHAALLKVLATTGKGEVVAGSPMKTGKS